MAKRSRNTVKRKRRRLIFGIELVVLLVLVGVLFVYANITNKLGKIDISDSLSGSILSPSPDSTVRSPAYFSRISSSLHAFLFWTSSTEPQYSHFFNPSF